MQLTFLGTGAAMPDGTRFQSGYLLESDSGTLLVDCGSGVVHALARTEVGYRGVDTLLLTHHHLDHVSDVAALLKARWLADEPAMTIAGPPGTADLIADLLAAHSYMEDRFDLTLRDLTAGASGTAGGFDFESMETRHSMQCFAYRLSPAGGSPVLTLSGDTAADEDLVAFADGSDVLVHDCSFPDDVGGENHATPSTLGAALAAVEPEIGEVYLTHLYPHTVGRHEEMLDAIAAAYDGPVAIAPEGETVPVGPD